MDSILTPHSEINRANKPDHTNDVETTGSIATTNYTPLFNFPVANYDMFIPTNPFSLNIDFGNYADQEAGTLASNSLFMQGFANAMATLFEGAFPSASSAGGAVAPAASSGCAGGSCSVGGGFTSVG